jgi:PKD repeat protein
MKKKLPHHEAAFFILDKLKMILFVDMNNTAPLIHMKYYSIALLILLTFSFVHCGKKRSVSFKTTGPREAGSPITFVNESQGVEKYLWDFGDGSYSVEANPKHIYKKEGLYNVKLQGIGGRNNITYEYKQDLMVYSILISDFSWADQVLFPNKSIFFSDSTKGEPTQWSWYIDGVLKGSNQNFTYSFTIPGTYSLMLQTKNLTTSSSISKDIHVENTATYLSGNYTLNGASQTGNTYGNWTSTISQGNNFAQILITKFSYVKANVYADVNYPNITINSQSVAGTGGSYYYVSGTGKVSNDSISIDYHILYVNSNIDIIGHDTYVKQN